MGQLAECDGDGGRDEKHERDQRNGHDASDSSTDSDEGGDPQLSPAGCRCIDHRKKLGGGTANGRSGGTSCGEHNDRGPRNDGRHRVGDGNGQADGEGAAADPGGGIARTPNDPVHKPDGESVRRKGDADPAQCRVEREGQQQRGTGGDIGEYSEGNPEITAGLCPEALPGKLRAGRGGEHRGHQRGGDRARPGDVGECR